MGGGENSDFYGVEEKCIEGFLWGNLGHLEYLRVGVKIILKQNSIKYNRSAWTELIWLTTEYIWDPVTTLMELTVP